MLQSLELNKKRGALVAAMPALAAAAGFWLRRNDFPWWDLGLIACGVWLILCLNYGLRGLAVGLKWLTGALILLAGVALSLFFQERTQGITWLTQEERASLGTLIAIPLMLYVPGWVQRRVRDHLEGPSPGELDLLHRQMGLAPGTEEPLSYDQWIGYKQLLNNLEEVVVYPSGFKRWLHWSLSGLVAAAGLLLMLIGYFRIESSQIGPWVLLAGGGLVVTALVLLLRGYFAALLTLAACGLIEFFLWGALAILSRAWATSKPLFAGLCALLVLALALGFLALMRHANRKYNPLRTIEDRDWILRLDPDLRELYPVGGYHQLIQGTWQIPVEFDLDRFHDDLHRFTLERHLVIGLTRQNPQGQMELLVYGKTQRQAGALKRWLLRRAMGIQLSQTTDPDWALFKTVLPSDETMICYHNGLIWQDLFDRGYPVNETGPMVLTAAFSDEASAQRMMAELRAEPHDRIEYENNPLLEETEGIDLHLVHLTKTFRLSKAWLDIETLKFHDLAKSLNGSFESLSLAGDPSGPMASGTSITSE